MADSRTRTLRLFVGLALLIAALAEGQTLLQSFRSERRFRARVERTQCTRLEEAWPELLPLLESGTSDRWARAAEKAQRVGLAREFEVFDLRGRLLFAAPASPPVGQAFDGALRDPVLGGQLRCVVVAASGGLRVMAYAAFPATKPDRVVRFAQDEPDLAEDLSERELSVRVHQMALGLLVVAGLLALWPARSGSEAASQTALGAYERAMETLREREVIVSDLHAAERARLSTALREREAFSRAGEITAQIVHEMRNGLGTILGYARILERNEGSDAARGRLVREECEALEKTIRRFVELVRDERPNLAPFDLGRMLERVAEREARPRARASPPVSLGPGLSQVVGDESLLERAFENLVRNALDAAGPQGSVALAAILDRETVVVTVSDDGPGLPANTEPKLLTSTKGGLGIGLSLARKAVTLHDGSLTLLNRTPRGVEAVVALPRSGPRAVLPSVAFPAAAALGREE